MLRDLFKKKTEIDEIEVAPDLKGEAKKLNAEDLHKHEAHFSEEKFWTKVQKFSKKAGTSVVYAVLLLYYTLQKPEVPIKVKATIVGALGYFILPLDIIPDIAVGVGYADDLSVVLFALVQAALYMDDDIKKQAKSKLKNLFGENVDTSEIDNKLGNGNDDDPKGE